jgi:subtilisin-like proprotein convertase family protein
LIKVFGKNWRRGASARARRKQERAIRLALEQLEDRSLLSTLPTPIVLGQTPITGIFFPGGGITANNQNTPSVAVDPLNPLHMAAVFGDHLVTSTANSIGIEAAFSSNGGKSWSQVAIPSNDVDPTTTNPKLQFSQAISPSIAFDLSHNFYITYVERNTSGNAGEIVIRKYAFGSSLPIILHPPFGDETVLYRWATIDGAATSTMVVDTNPATFMDPVSHVVQNDPFSGDIYVAWSNNITPPPPPVSPSFNPNPIFIASSSDGALTFSSPQILNSGHYSGADRNGSPQLVVGKGGQVTAVWDDFGTDATVPNDRVTSNRIVDGGAAAVFDLPPSVNHAGTLRSATSTTAVLDAGASSTDNAYTGQILNITGGTGVGQSEAITGYTGATMTATVAGWAVVPDSTSTFTITGRNIIDATDPGGGAPHIPGVTHFFNTVDFTGRPGFSPSGAITNLTVTLNLTHATLAQLEIDLVSPTGQLIPLLLNQIGPAGNTIAGQGVTGANLGILNGNQEGTVFDDLAFRSIVSGAAPFVGHFQPEVGSLRNLVPTVAAASGTWELRITDNRHDTNPNQFLNSWSLDFTSGLTPGTPTDVARPGVIGALTAPFVDKIKAAPDIGISAAPVLASDNTLGSFSQFQGRLYLAYVDNVYISDQAGNRTLIDHGNIKLTHSDNGGLSWSSPIQVNSDNSLDGYSAGLRTQFQPSLAVDQYTGELAVSFLDASLDPADSRVVNTVMVSNDGGQTFTKEVYANTTQTATDAITLKNVTLQPIPDNQSAGNSSKDGAFDFGVHQGLAFAQGQITPVWSSNENGGFNGNLSGKQQLSIWSGQIAVTAGPRIISSTMGPTQAFAADGTPVVNGFSVTFDRPVDPSTLTIGSVLAFFHDTISGSALVPIAIGGVTPFNVGPFGATSFFISFQTQQTKTGTYSYAILPTVRDSIRSPVGGPGNLMDQNANGIPGEAPTGVSLNDAYSAPLPSNGGPLFLAPYNQDTLPIIIPGPHIVNTRVAGGNGADNTVVDSTVSAIDVVFDRDMNPATVTPASVLRMIGPTGLISGPFTIVANPNGTDPNPLFPRTYRIKFPTQTIGGTYTVTLASSIQAKNGDALDTNENAGVDILLDKPSAGTRTITYNSTGAISIQPGATITSQITIPDNFVIQGLTLTLNVTDPDVRDLIGTLTGPDGTQVRLFTQVGGNIPPFSDFNNTVFDDLARTPQTSTNPIQTGRAPFTGSFNPQQPLSVFIGKAVPGTYTLTIQNVNASASVGSLDSWALNVQKAIPKTGLGEDVADQATASFRIFTMSQANVQSKNTWTAVGGASNNGGGNSSRVTGLAVDPSDPSGNTVYVGGASGGVWKTTNFLTTNPQGPTYVPLTDFGPTFAINIGGIDVFARNGDPKQSIIFASTGEGDTGSTGVGIIRSMDGGATWTLLDSTDNTKTPAQRDHKFVGTTSFKVVVDPVLSPTGVIVYAVLSGTNGGIWVSHDTGAHWTQTLAGQATDLVLTPSSADSTTGNLRVVYAAIRGTGVFISQNGGTSWNLMAGGVGDPLIRSDVTGNAIPVSAPAGTPNGAKGRIVLATPALTGHRAEDLTYQGWLYAYVATPDSHTDGLYLTKDFGQNWTKVKMGVVGDIRNQTPPLPAKPSLPTNDDTTPNNIDILGSAPGQVPAIAQGNYDISLAIDPINPNVVYLGGTADVLYTLLRVDTTGIADPHAELAYNNYLNDGGKVQVNTAGDISLNFPQNSYGLSPSRIENIDPEGLGRTHFLNLIRNPFSPFVANSTIIVTDNIKNFNNTGVRDAQAKVTPYNAVDGSTDQHRVISMIDPLTGHTRLIFGDDQGVFTAVDMGDGTFTNGIGTAQSVNGPRNGNLQIGQFYGGAVQPSQLAAEMAGALFYSAQQDNGIPNSTSSVLTTGNIGWSGPGGDATAVKTDQTGSGTVFQYVWPCCGGRNTDFFQVNGIGRTNGLLQAGDDPLNGKGQWPYLGGFNFAVNPVAGSGDQAEIVISSSNGNIFRTNTGGINWFLANPSGTGGNDGTNAHALAYGAPDPADPTQQLDNFIYAGTNAGHIFVTFNGGGAWTNISGGLDGSAVQDIYTNPHRGSHEAWAVTLNGVYFMANSSAVGATWTKITGNLFNIKHNPFGDSTLAENQLKYLTSIVADYRIAILDDPNNPTGPVHPVLYVGGEGGVYRSTDKGKTWTIFPDIADDQAPVDGGFLPDAHVTHLDLALGNINPATGTPIGPSPNLLVASTYGRGMFAIRLAGTAPLQENFFVRPDFKIFGQKFDATGVPTGNPFEVAPGSSLRTVTSARDAAGNLVLFGIDPYSNFVWEMKFDVNGNPTAPNFTNIWRLGAIQSIAVGHDGSGNLELFAVDPFFHHVYAMKFDSNDVPTAAGFILLSPGGVATKLIAGHDGNGNPLLFTIDPFFSQVQEMKFNAAGDPTTDFFRPGNSFPVKQIDLGYDGKGNPELFAIDPFFAHVFYLTMDANGTPTGPFFLQASPLGVVLSIAVGHDANNNPELFAIAPNYQIAALKFDSNGKPVGDFFPTGPSVISVYSISVGYSANGFVNLFGFGLGDNQIYEETFDAAGNRVRTWFQVIQNPVISFTAST